MTSSSTVFRVGTRSSRLARVQTDDAIRRIGECLPGLRFEVVAFSSPGDRDRVTDLRESPPDFFTRDLDEALAADRIDLAVHSAKDLPEPMPAGIDWCWLPWREDPRDVVVLPPGRGAASIPDAPRVGISSARREAWCRARFPGARMRSVRGGIEARLAQLDEGQYDLLVMAAAALIRLGLSERISEWIPPDELPAPDGQGVLAMTFRAGDRRLMRLRSLWVKAVVFCGGGAGRAGTCTVETQECIGNAEVCLYDALMDPAVLRALPPSARVFSVGKRCGSGGKGQEAINELLADHARRGARVVRLKGGDPGIFGRLAEEVDHLEALGLPYRVLPAVSSLQAATTGTGMLLTRRGESRGFCAMTPRAEKGAVTSVGKAAMAALPKVFFMAITSARAVLDELRGEGLSDDTPAAFVFDAGALSETVVRDTVRTLANEPPAGAADRPGLLIVGAAAGHGYERSQGAMGGRRVLLTCSEALQAEAIAITHDRGGIPVPFPSIRLTPVPGGLDPLRGETLFDWLVLTSPSAAHATVALMKESGLDLRMLPPILVCGDGTARALERHGLRAAARPERDFGAASLVEVARRVVRPGQRVLRLRSDAAGDTLACELESAGAAVTDSVIVRNEPIPHDAVPFFDAVLFASRSAVRSILDRSSPPDLTGRLVAAIGQPTADELRRRGIGPFVLGREATVASALDALAAACVAQALRREEGP